MLINYSVGNRKRLSLFRIFLLFPLALCLWWLLLEPVILPTLEMVVSPIIENIMFHDSVKLSLNPGKVWLVETDLIFEHEPFVKTLSFEMNLNALTLGLPLLWLCCFVFFHRPQGLNVFFGSLCLFILINLSVLLQITQQFYGVIERLGVTGQYFESGNIVLIEVPESIFLKMLSMVSICFFYINVFIFPIVYAYWANSDVILEILRSERK